MAALRKKAVSPRVEGFNFFLIIFSSHFFYNFCCNNIGFLINPFYIIRVTLEFFFIQSPILIRFFFR